MATLKSLYGKTNLLAIIDIEVVSVVTMELERSFRTPVNRSDLTYARDQDIV